MNKSVFITGATYGTGYCIAERFAKEGYDVFITSRELKKSLAAAEKLAAAYNVNAVGYELVPTDEDAVKEVFADIVKRGYHVDTVVLNAANLGIGQEFFSVDFADFMDVVTTNMGWNFLICREAAKQMRESGHGSIVFINSNSAYLATHDRSAYCSSKAGALGLARTLALDLGKYNIRVNCVLPGMIKTDRWKANLNGCRDSLANKTPLGDIAEFEDIANAAYYFGSDQSRNTTGAELVVDGGNSIRLTPDI